MSSSERRPTDIACWVVDMSGTGGVPEPPQEATPTTCRQKDPSTWEGDVQGDVDPKRVSECGGRIGRQGDVGGDVDGDHGLGSRHVIYHEPSTPGI